LRLLDTAAFAVPFAAALGRLGCALAHEHPGRLSKSWLAVRYPGGARYDRAA
jgi:prolipoprotein diacylglyceryltransferase